eukprot:6440126-Alexandrium_andersonii.AAC.1
MAMPMRAVESVYRAIRRKAFDPDQTRSGRWVDPKAAAGLGLSPGTPVGPVGGLAMAGSSSGE